MTCKCYQIEDEINEKYQDADRNLDQACAEWRARESELEDNEIEFGAGDDECYSCLEIVAQADDEASFVQAAIEIDWSQCPAMDLARAVHLALAAGAHLFARTLASYGYRLYPQHQELGKMAHILAPPRLVRSHLPPDPSG